MYIAVQDTVTTLLKNALVCRFTILGQISEAPKTLASAIAEIIRRKRFHEQFVKVTYVAFLCNIVD